MSLNQFPLQSNISQPRFLVLLNDLDITAAVTDISMTETTYYQADTFVVNLAIKNLPAGYAEDYFSTTSAMLIKIYAGFPKRLNGYTVRDLDELLVGQVDQVCGEVAVGYLTLTGRDLTAKFIDHKTTEKFQNLTASAIATKLAIKRGLKPVVTATTTKVGRYYNIDYARITSQISEWDLLTGLAQQEGFVVFVRGEELHFQPPVQPNADPYLIYYNGNDFTAPNANAVSIRYTRNLTLAGDIIVKLKSRKDGRTYTVTRKATPNAKTVNRQAAQPIGDAQVYAEFIPGLNKEQLIQLAQQKLETYSQHERIVEIEMPGDNLLHKDNLIKVQGLKTSYDQVYYPNHIERSLSTKGYRMTISAKNHSPNTQVLL